MGAMKFSVDYKQFARDMQRLDMRMRRAGSGSMHIVALQIAKDTEPYVPALTKSLANRTIVQDDVIIYPGPYARYLYNGKLMVDPETGSAWARKGATKVLTDRNLVFNQSVHGKAQDHWFEASKAVNMDKWERVARKAMKREFDR